MISGCKIPIAMLQTPSRQVQTLLNCSLSWNRGRYLFRVFNSIYEKNTAAQTTITLQRFFHRHLNSRVADFVDINLLTIQYKQYIISFTQAILATSHTKSMMNLP